MSNFSLINPFSVVKVFKNVCDGCYNFVVHQAKQSRLASCEAMTVHLCHTIYDIDGPTFAIKLTF